MFKEEYTQYIKPLYQYAVVVSGHQKLAETYLVDLFSQAFVFVHSDSHSSQTSFRNELFRILYHKIKTYEKINQPERITRDRYRPFYHLDVEYRSLLFLKEKIKLSFQDISLIHGIDLIEAFEKMADADKEMRSYWGETL